MYYTACLLLTAKLYSGAREDDLKWAWLVKSGRGRKNFARFARNYSLLANIAAPNRKFDKHVSKLILIEYFNLKLCYKVVLISK